MSSPRPLCPSTLDLLAQFSVLSRLKVPENSSLFSKMRVYDGETLKDTDPKAKSYQEYRDYAGVDEGMSGLSTRFAFKILSRVFNFDHSEVAANPVHLFYVIEQQVEREQFPQETADRYNEFLKGYLIPRYVEFIGKEIQTAYLESYSEYGQNILTATSPTPTSGFKIKSIAIQKRANYLTALHSTVNWRKLRKPRGSAIQKISVMKSLTSYCVPVPTTMAKPSVDQLREIAHCD